jgi:hypothetical protein
MVRQRYNHNRVFPDIGFDLLFDFTGLSGAIVGDLAPDPPQGPTPVSQLPSNWIIDWRQFHEVDGSVTPQASRKLDAFLARELHELPGGGGNLAFRNLKRGVQLGLPSGQTVAEAMGIASPVTADELASGSDGAVAAQHGLHLQTPLWYYILKEAQMKCDGVRLGPVGSTMVSEVLVGLVHGDRESYLWRKGPGWRPTLPGETAGDFTMADMLRMVGELNPIGD